MYKWTLSMQKTNAVSHESECFLLTLYRKVCQIKALLRDIIALLFLQCRKVAIKRFTAVSLFKLNIKFGKV